jgi:hypothetical protein
LSYSVCRPHLPSPERNTVTQRAGAGGRIHRRG